MSDLFGNHIVGFSTRWLIYYRSRLRFYGVGCAIFSNWWNIRAASWENQQCGFRTGLTQTSLYSHRRLLEAQNFGFRRKRNCTIHVAKTKALISFAVFLHRQIVGFPMWRFKLLRRRHRHDSVWGNGSWLRGKDCENSCMQMILLLDSITL